MINHVISEMGSFDSKFNLNDLQFYSHHMRANSELGLDFVKLCFLPNFPLINAVFMFQIFSWVSIPGKCNL